MAITFNAAAVQAVFDAIASAGEVLGIFDGGVIRHEPKSAPVTLPALAVWWEEIRPARSSGLINVSGVITLKGRVYQAKMLSEPQDGIDPGLLASVALLMAQWSGGFTLGGVAGIRSIDLLGMEGTTLSAVAGFITHENTMFRVAELTVPVIVEDMWSEGA